MTNPKTMKSQAILLKSLRKFQEQHEDNVRKYGSIVTKEAVFDTIELVLGSLYDDYSLMNADVEDYETPSALMLFVGGSLVALADYTGYEGTGQPVLYLSFHVTCMANTAIKINHYISKMVDIPVISTHVFYPIEENDADSSIILYNSQAIRAYSRDLSDSIYETRKRHESAFRNMKKTDKIIMH